MAYFILHTAPKYVKEQIYIAPVDTGHVVEHDDFSICPVCLGKQVLLERLLLLRGRESRVVVVLR